MGVEYSQRGASADVVGTIENKACAASSGEYSITVRTKDEKGESKTQQFTEFWQRDDDRPVKFSASYKIGDDVDLIGVRPGGLTCLCADVPAEAAQTDTTPKP